MSTTNKIDRADQRESVRMPYHSEISILIMDENKDVSGQDDFFIIQGSTVDVSHQGISFQCPHSIIKKRVQLYFKNLNTRQVYFDADIVSRQQLHQNMWCYGAKLDDDFREAVLPLLKSTSRTPCSE